MGYYDITNDIPIDLTFEGCNKKNHELLTLINYLNEKNLTNNCILILDRIYCKYEFVDYLIKNNYKFIVRFRNNCKFFNKIKEVKKTRILKFYEEHKNNITFEQYSKYTNPKPKKNKKRNNIKVNKNLLKTDGNLIVLKNADLIMRYEYTLLTNLEEKDYDDEEI